MRTQMMIAILALPWMAAPAAAQQNSTNQAQSAKQAPAKEQKYCIKFESSTGTRMKSTECKTKAEWAREGIEINR